MRRILVFSVASEPFECMDILWDLGAGTVPDLCSNMERVFGPREFFEGSDGDLDHLIDQVKQFPLVYHACGKQDILYEMNQRLRTHMEQAFPEDRYLYYESDGGHDWFFWNEQLKEMARIFGFI